MVSTTDNLQYSIIIPADTKQEIIEWFEFINTYGNLSSELIKLVNDNIVNNSCFKPQNVVQDNLNTSVLSYQNNLVDSLYNWDEAISSIFNEDRKPKKKMLSV